MQFKSSVLSSLTIAMLSTGVMTAHAAEAPYYNPSNTASQSGKTIGYELFRTIGCPGRGILEAPCAVPPAPAPVQVQAKSAPVVKIPDSDGDGVADDKDRCANTPAGAKVDARGCEVDSDKDGVVDRLDQCPDTPIGRVVNAQGCELDSDKDGIVDALDQCPDTPAGRVVNAQGCELDGDKDGVVDALDKCPTTPASRVVNAQGCELDGDKDGVVDALDQCPTTPAGRVVNAQGCEPDGDKDGIIDAVDQCPATPVGDRVDGKGCSIPNALNLVGVNFDDGKDNLRPESTRILNEAVEILKRYPGLKIEIAGHTDSRDSDLRNQILSEKRAQAVMQYFVENGIDASRLQTKGYGESMPISGNDTPEGRFKNRRVELLSLN
jgi:outer membrane protein OmpA-like peptidoglycan-associated protein